MVRCRPMTGWILDKLPLWWARGYRPARIQTAELCAGRWARAPARVTPASTTSGAHGGTISVASVPADGATFRVELPLGT